MKKTTMFAALLFAALMVSCGGKGGEKTADAGCGGHSHGACASKTGGEGCGSGACGGGETTCQNSQKMNKTAFQKKYTNADFYKDGKFQQEVAEKAFREMFAHYGYPVTPFMEENWWFTDFGMGDFENCGMGGIFWHNNPSDDYLAHDIYLLPGQMIPEHKHVKTEYPAKMESWIVDYGWAYNYSEVGEPTPNAPELPASQKATIKSKTFVKQMPNNVVNLSDAGAETWHFLIAGDEGAIITEFANYHDGAGLKFSNPAAKM